MSPLARSLLALACAALLQAACAELKPPICHTVSAKYINGFKIELPEIRVLTSLGPEIDYKIPDNCERQGKVLQGETATVCDWYAQPGVGISNDLSVVHVSRKQFDPSEPDATLQVDQYCQEPRQS